MTPIKSENHANVIEVLGRNHLIAQLIQDDVHAAIPLWDKGIDLIAYFGDESGTHARPIQLKANEDARWGLDRKYESIPQLLMVYVWHVREFNKVEIYAMTYAEAYTILADNGYTEAECWKKRNGRYTIPSVNASLTAKLKGYRMQPKQWRERLVRL